MQELKAIAKRHGIILDRFVGTDEAGNNIERTKKPGKTGRKVKNEKGEDIGGIENTAIATNPIQTGGLGDQGLMDRLTSLEQGIGSLQNQIANLFQMGQASDPFGLGSFINTRRY